MGNEEVYLEKKLQKESIKCLVINEYELERKDNQKTKVIAISGAE